MIKVGYILVLFLVVLFACKTSGDLRAEKESVDPGEIKTVTSQMGVAPPSNTSRNRVAPNPPTVANPGNRMANEELLRQVEVLKGEIQEQNFLKEQQKNQYESKISTLESERSKYLEEIQILKGTAPQSASKGGDLLLETAKHDTSTKNFDKAAQGYKEFLENYPQDARTESVLVLKAQNEYAAGAFKTSMVNFGQYLDKFPKGKERPMAWLGQAAALIRMKQKKDAKLFLEQCIALFPKSHEAKLSKRLLKNPNLVPPTLFEI